MYQTLRLSLGDRFLCGFQISFLHFPFPSSLDLHYALIIGEVFLLREKDKESELQRKQTQETGSLRFSCVSL